MDPDAPPSTMLTRADHGCFGCGDGNPCGLKLKFQTVRAGEVVAEFTPRRQDEGFFDVVHGGIVGTMLDEAMAWAAFADGVWAVTARMELRFLAPVVVGTPVTVHGVVTKHRGRVIETSGRITRVEDGVVLAEATGTFMRVPEAQARAWQERYLQQGNT